MPTDPTTKPGLDLRRYEGHTPGPLVYNPANCAVETHEGRRIAAVQPTTTLRDPTGRLLADAPLLLIRVAGLMAEVETLREELAEAKAALEKARMKKGVFGDGVFAGGDAAKSSDPYALVKAACEHWYNIGWPEDERPVAMLMRALEILGGPESREQVGAAAQDKRIWCPQCGGGVAGDEDGCCATCGADLIRPEVLRAIRCKPAPGRLS